MSLTTYDILIDNFKFDKDDALNFVTVAGQLGLTLDDFLHGKVYKKHPTEVSGYSEAEQKKFVEDLVKAHARLFTEKSPQDKKEYIVSAGAPGVGKSAFLEHHIVDPFSVYIDADREIMRFMSGYDKYVAEHGGEKAYEFYRDASKFIANFLTVFAIFKGYSVVHGTTFTDERVARILSGLKKQNYNTTVYVMFADKDSRAAALKHRVNNEKFFQITEADAQGKVAPVFDRISDAYMKYADQVIFSYNTKNYWQNRFPRYDSLTLRVFASAKRENDKLVINWLPKNDDIFEVIKKDIKAEASPTKQDELIEMFDQAHIACVQRTFAAERRERGASQDFKDFDAKELIKRLEPKPYNFQQMFSRANLTTGALTFVGAAVTVAFASKLVNRTSTADHSYETHTADAHAVRCEL